MKNTCRRNSLSTLVHFYVHVVILFFLLSLFFKTSFTGAGCVQKTTTGQCCSIPFTYKGVKYHSCTTADHNQLWCSLDAVYKGKWGNCGKHWNNAGIKFKKKKIRINIHENKKKSKSSSNIVKSPTCRWTPFICQCRDRGFNGCVINSFIHVKGMFAQNMSTINLRVRYHRTFNQNFYLKYTDKRHKVITVLFLPPFQIVLLHF